ncbi:hypothetical protein PINS_up012583 [Pythium insidiosum]|nr:hypothetical protein PINS_up012583 [Pythium insidiosum]
MQLRTTAVTLLLLLTGLVHMQVASACNEEVLFQIQQTPHGLQCFAETKLSFTGVSPFIDAGVRRGCTTACRAVIRDVQTRLPDECYLLYYPTGNGVRPRLFRLYADVINKFMPDCLKDESTDAPVTPTPTATATATATLPPSPTTQPPTATPVPATTTAAPVPSTPTTTTALPLPTPPPTAASTPSPPPTATPTPPTTTNSTPSSTEVARPIADDDKSGSLSSVAPPTSTTQVPSLTKQPLRSPTATPKSSAAVVDVSSCASLVATIFTSVVILVAL